MIGVGGRRERGHCAAPSAYGRNLSWADYGGGANSTHYIRSKQQITRANVGQLEVAGLLYRRAIAGDASLYGPETLEIAADIANPGMLTKDAGQPAAGEALLRQSPAIYEKTIGHDSDEARFVRDRLTKSGRWSVTSFRNAISAMPSPRKPSAGAPQARR